MISASIAGWAAKVFPDMAADEAEAQLWETIFAACRINQDDPVAGWESHISKVKLPLSLALDVA